MELNCENNPTMVVFGIAKNDSSPLKNVNESNRYQIMALCTKVIIGKYIIGFYMKKIHL
jgi:hypothetical protein